MASITKRSGQYRVRWRDPDGRARSRQCPTFTAAKALKLEVEEAVSRGHRWEPRDVRPVPDLVELMKAYLREVARLKSRNTTIAYGSHLNRFKAFLREKQPRGRLHADLLSRDLLREYVAEHLDHVGARTRWQLVRSVERFWRWAEDEYEGVPRPRKLAMPPVPVLIAPVAPTWAEMDACIAQLSGPARKVTLVQRFTGLRRAQVLQLEWTDFDLERATLHVRGELGKSTSERSGRVVPLSQHLVDELAGWGVREGRLVEGRRSGFVSLNEDVVAGWEACDARTAVWKPPGHGKAQPTHAFRKGFVSGLRGLGANPDAVEFLVGHSLGLRGVYTDPNAIGLRDAIELIPALGSESCVPSVSQLPRRRGEGE